MEGVKRNPGAVVLLVKFKEYLKLKHYDTETITSYWNSVFKFLLWIEKTYDKQVNKITREDVLAYRKYLIEYGYAPASVECYLNCVRQFFKWLEKELYILINPCENMMLPKAKALERVILTQAEVKKLIDAPNVATMPGIRDRAILETFYSTGLRLSELYNLTIYDIDTAAGFVRVTNGKFSKDRFAPLTKAASYWLKEYINRVRPCFIKSNPREQALFLGNHWGRKFNKLLISRMIMGYAKVAGLKKRVTAHTLRHSLATHMLDNDADIFAVQKLMGHVFLSTTQQYTHVHLRQLRAIHNKLHPREQDKKGE